MKVVSKSVHWDKAIPLRFYSIGKLSEQMTYLSLVDQEHAIHETETCKHENAGQEASRLAKWITLLPCMAGVKGSNPASTLNTWSLHVLAKLWVVCFSPPGQRHAL